MNLMKMFVMVENALKMIFFYFYSYVIIDSHVTFSLDGMIMDVDKCL